MGVWFLYSGSYVVNVEASPMLRSVVMNASQQTPSSDAMLDHNSAETIYDTWLLRSPSDFDSYLPRSSLANSLVLFFNVPYWLRDYIVPRFVCWFWRYMNCILTSLLIYFLKCKLVQFPCWRWHRRMLITVCRLIEVNKYSSVWSYTSVITSVT